jgi:TorA maturation chaperone TorD
MILPAVIDHRANELKNLFLQFRLPWLDEFLAKLTTQAGKKEFLVFKEQQVYQCPH